MNLASGECGASAYGQPIVGGTVGRAVIVRW